MREARRKRIHQNSVLSAYRYQNCIFCSNGMTEESN